MKIKIIRHLIQYTALVIMILPIYFSGTIWFGTYISGDLLGIELTDPFTAVEIMLASKMFWLPLLISAIPLAVIAIFFGRVFCSYVCPLNTILELIPVNKKIELKNKMLPVYSMLTILVVSTLISFPIFNAVSPVYTLMRVILFGVGAEIIIVLLAVGAGFIWGKKIWCRTLCPVGAMYGLLGMKKRLVVDIDYSKCIECGKCSMECTMGLIPNSKDSGYKFSCTNCGDCVSACNQKAISYKLR